MNSSKHGRASPDQPATRANRLAALPAESLQLANIELSDAGRSRVFSSPYAVFWLPAVAALAAVLVWLTLPLEQGLALLAEDAPVEQATALLFLLLAPTVWLMRRPGDEGRVLLAASVAFAAFGARELDLHHAWDGVNVLRVSFYLHEAPLYQKLIAGPVVVAVGIALAYLFLRFTVPVWRALRRREPLAVTIACFFLTMAISKVLDRWVNILTGDFGIQVSVTVDYLSSALEEILELSLPLIAAMGLAQRRRGSPRR